jgi:hypothetical protein
MKNILYTATLIVLPLLSIAQTELKINAEIRGRSCNGGLGLCSVSSTLEMQKTNQEIKTKALKINDTTIVLAFDKALLSEQEQKSLFNSTLSKITTTEKIDFIQEDDLTIDIQTLLLLGIDPKYNTLKKGNYPLIIANDTIKVTLKLWEQ